MTLWYYEETVAVAYISLWRWHIAVISAAPCVMAVASSVMQMHTIQQQ